MRAATRNLSRESSAQCKDFNLKRVLFYRENHGRLFNRIGRSVLLDPVRQFQDGSFQGEQGRE
ncbi:hypothetical protein EMIT0P258_180005 [Pseudomonas sp. IT-P258]